MHNPSTLQEFST